MGGKRIWEKIWDEKQYGELMKRRATGSEPEMEQVKQLVKLFNSVYKPGMKVLDIGCGAAHFYPPLKKIDENISYRGVDISERYINIANEIFGGENNFEVSIGDIFDLGFDDNSYDITICYMVLPFIPDYPKAVKEIMRVTKKHSFIRLLLSDYTYTCKIYKEGYGENAPFEYYNTYSEKEFVKCLKDNGAKEVKVIKDEFNIKLEKKKELPFSTYTYGDLQIIGNLVLDWRVVHAIK